MLYMELLPVVAVIELPEVDILVDLPVQARVISESDCVRRERLWPEVEWDKESALASRAYHRNPGALQDASQDYPFRRNIGLSVERANHVGTHAQSGAP
jgi:hypothetical protein